VTEGARSTIAGDDGLAPIEKTIRNSGVLGIDIAKLQEAGERDDDHRRVSHASTWNGASQGWNRRECDARKRKKKLDDDFTPRLDMTLVGLEGVARRDITRKCNTRFQAAAHMKVKSPSALETVLFFRSRIPGVCMKTAQLARENASDLHGQRRNGAEASTCYVRV